MSNLTHLFHVGQKVKTRWQESWEAKPRWYDGTVKETYKDHIIVDVPMISDHCWYEEGFNLDTIYPVYNFEGV